MSHPSSMISLMKSKHESHNAFTLRMTDCLDREKINIHAVLKSCFTLIRVFFLFGRLLRVRGLSHEHNDCKVYL